MDQAPKAKGRPRKSQIATVETTETYVAPTVQVATQVSAAPAVAVNGQHRTFGTQSQYTHDLFKLELATFKKNVALAGHEPEYENAEHVHWFHTITSDGKPQTRASSVGGHFHKVEVISQGEGKPPIVRCASGPLKEVVTMQYGKRVKKEIPVNDVDSHTHNIKYIKSDIIIERTRNIEAAKAEAAIMARYQASVPGVEAGE